jgi:hypothetical protein
MTKITIDAAWVAELVRQGVYLAVAMKWWDGDLTQQTLLIAFLSLLLTGIVGMFTASTRVLERAGTSVNEVKRLAGDQSQELRPVTIDGSKD